MSRHAGRLTGAPLTPEVVIGDVVASVRESLRWHRDAAGRRHRVVVDVGRGEGVHTRDADPSGTPYAPGSLFGDDRPIAGTQRLPYARWLFSYCGLAADTGYIDSFFPRTSSCLLARPGPSAANPPPLFSRPDRWTIAMLSACGLEAARMLAQAHWRGWLRPSPDQAPRRVRACPGLPSKRNPARESRFLRLRDAEVRSATGERGD
jgi:hypothetical protein